MRSLIETMSSLSFNEDEFICNNDKDNSISYVISLDSSSEDLFEVRGLAYYFFYIIINSGRSKKEDIEKLHRMVLEKYCISEEKLFSDIDSFIKTAMEQRILV